MIEINKSQNSQRPLTILLQFTQERSLQSNSHLLCMVLIQDHMAYMWKRADHNQSHIKAIPDSYASRNRDKRKHSNAPDS